MYGDLHFHSLDSDGKKSNQEILSQLDSIDPRRIGYWAMTNHDLYTREFVEGGRNIGLKTLWATEISAHSNELDTSLHVTCYTSTLVKDIQQSTDMILQGKKAKVESQIQKLQSNGFPIDTHTFFSWVQAHGYRTLSVSNAHITEYLFSPEREESTRHVLAHFGIGVYMTPTQFLNECLKEAGEYSHLGYSQIEPYEPELADLIHRLPHDDIILSIAHPNFSFSPVYKRYKMNSSLESRMQCFRERILPVLDDIGIRNYEINAKATPNQVQMIADIVIKRGGYITYGSDNHGYTKESPKHGTLGIQNSALTYDMIRGTLRKLEEFVG